MIFRRNRFSEVIHRQLDFFEEENADLIRRVHEAERVYDRAERDEAEERYGDYMDLVDEGTAILAGLRDHYAAALDEDAADQYRAEFDRAVGRRLGVFALDIEDT